MPYRPLPYYRDSLIFKNRFCYLSFFFLFFNICVCLSLAIYFSVCLSLFIFLSVYRLYLSVCLSLLSFCLSIAFIILSVYRFYLSVCLSIFIILFSYLSSAFCISLFSLRSLSSPPPKRTRRNYYLTC